MLLYWELLVGSLFIGLFIVGKVDTNNTEEKSQDTKTLDPKTTITITIEELQTLLQFERLSALTPSIMDKINKQV